MALPLAQIFYHYSFQPPLPSARQISAFINKQLSTNASLNNVLCNFSPAAVTPRCFFFFQPSSLPSEWFYLFFFTLVDVHCKKRNWWKGFKKVSKMLFFEVLSAVLKGYFTQKMKILS